MAEQNGAQHRPSSGQYPSPQSYPSPQMHPSYAYPPPQGQPPEPYRHSPTASNAPLPPMNLPPLRSIDGQPPPPQQSGSTLPQGMPPMPAYYPPPPGSLPHPGQAIPNYARYAPIPQGGPMPGGRQKKEIKRRTKTGCLTCRKRRIKCDEQHPICRNCQKSKRECMGYDPIFKQQSGPQALQPAPSASPSSASPTPASTSAAPAPFPAAQSNYPPPQGAAYPPTPTTALAPPPQHSNQSSFEYGSAIDPALAESPKVDRKPSDTNNSCQPAPALKMEESKGKPARQLHVDELFQVDRFGPYPIPSNPEPLSEQTIQTIKQVYINDFAPGLDKLLETDWFYTSGLQTLLANQALCQQMAQLIKHFSVVGKRNGYEAESMVRATETKMVWQLLGLCTYQSAGTNGANGYVAPSQIDLEAASGRLEVLECLITNRILDGNRLKAIPWAEEWPQQKKDDIVFWSAVAKFAARRNDDPAAAQDIDKYLMQSRNTLVGRENRDVIYSIMVARHLGWRVPGFPDHAEPEQGGEGSDINKVFIARIFLVEEAQQRGTNHPIQRLCDMVIRSWAVGWA